MKKKKLKRKIKKLERDIKWLRSCNHNIVLRHDATNSHVEALKSMVTKLEQDNKYYKEWMDRSGVDYKSWFNFEEKTCDTCKWKPLMEQDGQEAICMGCTGDNGWKMWKSKD